MVASLPTKLSKNPPRSEGDDDQPMYALEAGAVVEKLRSNSTTGLDESEIQSRREQFGTNTIQSIKGRSAWRILIDQFLSLIVALLAAASLVAWLTKDRVESMAILVVLILNAIVGFLTEWQAGKALDALRRQSKTMARVRRNGRESIVDATDLLPGDIVILNSGDLVSADMRLLEAANLRIEESALTGESTTVEKYIAPVAAETLLAERHCMIYLGTSVAAGRAIAIVTAIGAETELGKIGKLVASASNETTPLERRLGQLGRRLVLLVLAIAVIVFLTGWLRGDDLWLMVEVAISLAVAAVPEGLPAVTTLILALGVLQMAREHAIVRRLPAVETLGCTTVICSDKTGTLTENRMTVCEYRRTDGETQFPSDSFSTSEDNLFNRILRVSLLCNEASLDHKSMKAVGDPTEIALLEAAQKLGINIDDFRSKYPKLKEEPFDASTKRMLTIHRLSDDRQLAALKGGPSAVLGSCLNYIDANNQIELLDEKARARFLQVNEEMADRALRVLALAEKVITPTDSAEDSGFTFLGYVGMSDPPRAAVPAAIADALTAGVRVVMLTGDQLHTAQSLAVSLKLNGDQEPVAVHATDLTDADHHQIIEMVRRASVFARVSPADKLRIVEALQKENEIIAVTGDGVNDAPALKQADIGIAMGLRGTEVAKEAADVVLADDNFSTIVKAIARGRTIYSNITKFVHLMFSENLAEVIVIFWAMIAGWPLPLLPLQILWMNLVTDVFPALALAVEPEAPDVMQRPPKSPQAAMLSKQFLILIFWQSAMLASICLIAYRWALKTYGEGAQARTIALLTLIGVQLGHTFNCRSRTRSAFDGIWLNPFLWVAVAIVLGLQLLAIYFGPLARVLNIASLNPIDWTVMIASILLPIVIVETVKWIGRARKIEE